MIAGVSERIKSECKCRLLEYRFFFSKLLRMTQKIKQLRIHKKFCITLNLIQKTRTIMKFSFFILEVVYFCFEALLTVPEVKLVQRVLSLPLSRRYSTSWRGERERTLGTSLECVLAGVIVLYSWYKALLPRVLLSTQ